MKESYFLDLKGVSIGTVYKCRVLKAVIFKKFGTFLRKKEYFFEIPLDGKIQNKGIF